MLQGRSYCTSSLEKTAERLRGGVYHLLGILDMGLELDGSKKVEDYPLRSGAQPAQVLSSSILGQVKNGFIKGKGSFFSLWATN